MANRVRGEVPLELGGRHFTLCFTLGALAELEDALQAGDLAGLAARFGGGGLGARDLIALLGAALRGGGHEIDDAGVSRLPLAGGIDAITAALGQALAAAFGEWPAEESHQDPPSPRAAESRA